MPYVSWYCAKRFVFSLSKKVGQVELLWCLIFFLKISVNQPNVTMCCLCKVSTWFLLHYSLYFFMFGNFNNLKRKKKSSHTVVCLASCLYTKCFLYLHIFLHLEQLMGYPPNKLLGGKKDEQRRRTFYLPFPVLWWCFFVCLLCFEKRWK